MTAFQYTAKIREGQTIQAEVEASTRAEALSVLRTEGLTILNLTEEVCPPVQTPARSLLKWMRPMVNHPRRIPKGVLAVFCRQLSISLNAGVPLREALESIKQDEDHPGLRRKLDHIVELLNDGFPLSDALERQGGHFGTLFVSLIRSAEEAGSLGESLAQLATYLERSEQLQRKIRSVTAYPAFVALFFFSMCFIMTLVVLPRFRNIFADFSAELPMITRVVFGFSEWMMSNVIGLAIAGGAFIGIIWLVGKSDRSRVIFDRFVLRLPVLGATWQRIAVSRFSRNLAMMTRGGVPIASGIEIAAAVCGNQALKIALCRSADRIINGSEIANSFEVEKVFPRLFVRMVGIGERTGQLPEVLDKVAESYEKQVEGMIIVTMAIAEPAFICFFGILILIMVLAIYVPIFSVSSHV